MTDSGRRVHERFECELDVTLLCEDEEIAGKAVNVSLGGMLIQCDVDLSYGTELKVRVRLPALKEDVEVPVTVRWRAPGGTGMQFGSLRAREVWAINELVKKG